MANSLGTLFKNCPNNFNLIRLIAALSVIYGHASVVTGGNEPDLVLKFFGYKFIGGIAVDVFFILSGFLITASIQGSGGVLYYVASRFLRIFPALFICLISSVLVLGLFYSEKFTFFSKEVWRYIWINGLAINTEYFIPGVFAERPNKAVNGSLWSIPVEVRMYAAVLFFYLIGLYRSKVIFNSVFFISLVFFYFKPDLLTVHLLHPTHLGVVVMFFMGSFYWVNRDEIVIHPFVLLTLLFFAAAMHNTQKFAFAYSLLIPYAVWCIAFVPGFFAFNKLGDYSYGVYLYGWPLQQMVAASFPEMSSGNNAIASSILALICGIFSWKFIEKPVLKFKNHLKNRKLGFK